MQGTQSSQPHDLRRRTFADHLVVSCKVALDVRHVCCSTLSVLMSPVNGPLSHTLVQGDERQYRQKLTVQSMSVFPIVNQDLSPMSR